jgi:hypothetical protein
MNPENITAWATVATAIGALALIGVTLWLEYSRRRHERAQLHINQLRSLLFEPLRQQIIGHYLPILQRQDGLIKLDTQEVSSAYDPLHGRTIQWTSVLKVKSASPSIGYTIGEHQRFKDHDATFPHLYLDAKMAHFQKLFQRWEHFQEQVEKLGKESLQHCLRWQRHLEELVCLPAQHDISAPRPWANYVALSLYIYEQFWLRYPNGASSFQESGYSTFRYNSSDLVQGEQERVAVCLETLAQLIKAESVPDLIQGAERLECEAIALKEEFERLVLKQISLGSCPYLS